MPVVLATTTDAVISDIGRRLTNNLPVGAKIVSALLFATGKEGPTDVHVPVTDGARTALYLPWLGTDPDYPLTNATYFDLDMHLDDGTHCAFTVFVADQHNPVGRSDVDHPVNEQVSGHLLHGAIWKGNVLVMRRDSSDGPFSDIRAVDRTHGMSCVVCAVLDYNRAGTVLSLA